MSVIIPNSFGVPPREEVSSARVREVWSDAARASALTTRRAGRKGLWDPEKKKKAGGSPAKPKKPTKDKDETNDQGERVSHYSDGSTVTQHKDGKATHRTADGRETKGRYAEPVSKDTPEGFKADTPESEARDARRRETDAKRATAAEKRAAKDAEMKKTKKKPSSTLNYWRGNPR